MKKLRLKRNNLLNLPLRGNSHGYEIRAYTPQDKLAWIEIMNGQIGEWNEERFDEAMLQDVRYSFIDIFIAVQKEKVIASASAANRYCDPENCGYLHMVAVHPEFHGKGIGKEITVHTLEHLRNGGFLAAHLDTDDWRLSAIQVYWGLGFRPVMIEEDHPKRWETVMKHLGLEQ